MALYLVQHGKNLSKEIDPEQSLSEEGRREVEKIAETAANYDVIVGKIHHSGKKRAEQTAEILAEKLGVNDVSEAGGLKALDEPAEFVKDIIPGENLMLVGHLPFMERMASLLVTGKTDYTVFKFQNGGIVCLDRLPDSGLWAVMWALMPNIGGP
ncbi:MAG: phosphohistidine phosphatase SixA [Desulfobacteraceae bacterium]|nr:phosphohistidine phosphatase SixA [Desulfobacteraceae bacterium]